MAQYPVCIGMPDKEGRTHFANYEFPTHEAALKFVSDCHDAYRRMLAGGARRSAIINPMSKKEFKQQCRNRN